MRTWHIHIEGQVQGVGFRPFVFALAQEYGFKGWVNNSVDGVHIVFNAQEHKALAFKKTVIAEAPRLSELTSITLKEIPQAFFDTFRIIHSEVKGAPKLLLTPDFALCKDCRTEMREPSDRRFQYAFITCTNCGPRYSILHSLPYDRENTTMDTFQMCSTCSEEYHNPLDRRYYSQTNSCAECGIEQLLYDTNRKVLTTNPVEIKKQVTHYWELGKIIAIKGIGGYLLTCDASNEAAILELRKRKHRPSKPFALMLPNTSAIPELKIEEEAAKQLENHISPIVLIELAEHVPISTAIAPGLQQLGVMLPYTPLYEQLLQHFAKPIIATSGNLSNAPIIYQDEKALSDLSGIADFILSNNRAIVIPQDDSVLKFSFFKKHKITLRRSRGLAPTYINPNSDWPEQSILAMGAMLKSTVSYLHQGNVYISQYLGDLEHFDTQQSYEHTIQHFLRLLGRKPDIILGDQHPEYPSTQIGAQYAKEWECPFRRIQHHLAHFGAILGEHQLMDSEVPVLGVIWDGTGLGNDGQIWGGEFFKYNKYQFSRCYFFEYFNFILGDKMPKEPRISALSACWGIEGSKTLLKDKFSKTEWQIYSKMVEQEHPLKTSSAGRVFDAVASLLGLVDKQSYEGEAAIQLESLATQYFKKHGLDFTANYFKEEITSRQIPTKMLFSGLILDIQKGESKAFIAAKFHFSLIQLIKSIANNLKIQSIAFSGGVFQNSLLVDLISHHLAEDFELFFHKQLSPNDENISFGQLVCYQIENRKGAIIK